MKKLFFAIVIALFTLSVNAQQVKTTTTVDTESNKQPNTTVTTVGKGVILTNTGQDPLGNTWILHQNLSAKGKLRNWNFIVMNKNGGVAFSDSGKKGTFGKVAGYQQGGWVSHVRESGSPFGRNYGTGAGVVNGSNVRRF
ncbi:MAG: hypothetical protein QG644_9 [Patescibacteria group bacterium]|nr:hypothetical protein [Patescibacteria group bacterium]